MIPNEVKEGWHHHAVKRLSALSKGITSNRHGDYPLQQKTNLNLMKKYLKERNCLRDKVSRFSRIFAKFAKLNPREKFTVSQFSKKKINDGHVKNILQDIKESRIKSFISKQCYFKYRKIWARVP